MNNFRLGLFVAALAFAVYLLTPGVALASQDPGPIPRLHNEPVNINSFEWSPVQNPSQDPGPIPRLHNEPVNVNSI